MGVNPFSLQNGALDITATPGSNPLNLPYNSSVITTQNSFSQLYGYFEINAQMPAGQGLWPAFWMLPASGAWPPELDIFEVLGNAPTTLYFLTHSTVQATQGTTLNVANVSSGFNKYGVMWGPQTVDLYINGVEVASMATPADMNVPMYMLANLAVGGYWPGNPNSSTVFPATMKIDYVHACAYPGTTGGTVYETLPSQNIGAAAVAPTISAPTGFQTATGVETHISGVSIAANWPGGFFTVMVSDNKALLHTAPTTDVYASGEGTTFLTLTGNLSAINASLATLTYQGTATGDDWMWVGATNPQGQQGTKNIVATDVASIAQVISPPVVTTLPVVTPLPAGPPIVTAPAAMTLAAGATQALPGIAVSSGQTGGTIVVKISDSTGLLRTTAVTGVTELGEGTTSLTLTGGLAAVNAELGSLTYQANMVAGSDWLWVSADDASGAQSINHDVVTVLPAAAVVNGLLTGPQATVLTGMSLVGGALQVDGGRVVKNTGTLTWNGGTIALGSGDPTATNHTGTLDNAAGALFAIQGNATLTGSGTSGLIDNGTVDVSAGTLTVSDGTHSSAFSLTGSYNTAGFHMASDNHGGTAVTFS